MDIKKHPGDEDEEVKQKPLDMSDEEVDPTELLDMEEDEEEEAPLFEEDEV